MTHSLMNFKTFCALGVLILSLGSFSLSSLAAAECFPAGTRINLQKLTFLDQVTLGPSQKYVLVQSEVPSDANVYELPTGKQASLTKPSGAIFKFISDHELAIQDRGKWTVIDLANMKRHALPKAEAVALDASANALNSLPLTTTVPLTGNMILSKTPIFGGHALLELVSEKQLCAEPAFMQLSEEETAAALRKFSKPDGFSNSSDLALWLAIVQSHKATPGLLAASLLGILVQSPELYEALSEKAGNVANFSSLDQTSLSKDEKLTVEEHLQSYLVRTFRAQRDIHFDTLKRYAPLVRSLSSADDKDKLLEIVGYRATEDAALMPEFADMTPYQVFAFAYNAAALLFKTVDAVSFTDLVAAQVPGKINLTLLGTEPVDESKPNIFGFYSKAIENMKPDELSRPSQLKWNWSQGEKQYEALIDVQPNPPRPAITPPKTFSNKNRNGMVVIGSNLEVELTKSTLAEYRRYFENAGYKFGKPKAEADLYGYLAKRLSNRRHAVDYFIKEAHSNGNGDIVLKVASRGFVLHGIKTKGGADTQSFDILYNLESDPTERFVSNANFGDWLSKRYYSRLRPLVYINSSCWSYAKAALELGWMRSPGIFEISALGPVNMIEDNNDSAEKVLLDGIRSGRSFEKIRTVLKKQAGYASGFEDQFVFPDDETYARKIARYGVSPVKISRQFFTWNEKGKKITYVPDGY